MVENELFVWSNENYTVPAGEELFGFGSGEFLKGAEAKDVMSDCEARWLVFDLSKDGARVIMEHSRKLPEHLRELDLFNKARS